MLPKTSPWQIKPRSSQQSGGLVRRRIWTTSPVEPTSARHSVHFEMNSSSYREPVRRSPQSTALSSIIATHGEIRKPITIPRFRNYQKIKRLSPMPLLHPYTRASPRPPSPRFHSWGLQMGLLHSLLAVAGYPPLV